jgi:phenylacetate-CoA ligase
MSEFPLRLYYAAPPHLRGMLASFEGYRLRWQRYGGNAEERVASFLDHERMSVSERTRLQKEQLARTLHRAATRVPYYRNLWEERRRKGDSRSPALLADWPYLEKEDLRRSAREFVADDSHLSRMRHSLTSGTTGQPIHFWYGAETDRNWWALCEARWRRWNGVSRHDRWALLAGRLVVPVDQKTAPFWVWNRGLRQLYLSAYHLWPEALPRYLEALDKYEVSYIWGHSSALHALAREALRLRKRLPMRLVLTTAEPLFDAQRNAIEAAFECPVKETYGMAEMAAAASQCEAGRMHFWPELGWLEFVPVEPHGTTAEIVVTTFLNPDMPLIRYRTGDLTDVGEIRETCPCGRTLPLLAKIEGRTSDILYTFDGRQISPSAAEIVFDTDLGLQEAQLIQEDFDRVVVRFVAPPGSTSQIEMVLKERIVARFGPVKVDFEPVAHVARGPNGKFRAAVCRIPSHLRNTVHSSPVH